MAAEFWALMQTDYTAPESVALHGTFLPASWDICMTCLQLGEGEQKALQGPVDLADLLSGEIVIKAWDGLDIDMAKAP